MDANGNFDFQFNTALVPRSPEQTWNGSENLYANDGYSLEFSDLTLFQTISHPLSPENNYVQGLLYVPMLGSGYAECVNNSNISIPANVTTLESSFPHTWSTMAIFPWSDESCAQAYLDQAKLDGVQGIFTFLLDQGTSIVPNASEPSWSLRGNNSWQATYPHTVFAITAADGRSLLTELSYYSGSMSDAPFGHNLTEYYGSQYLPRIYASVWSDYDFPSAPQWPAGAGVGVGLFLLLVLYVPLSAWFLRRRQVRSFQHRLQRGEVDLEALGIKQTTVPDELINKMPLYTFMASSNESTLTKTSNTGSRSEQPGDLALRSTIAQSASEMFSSSSQTTCSICLDEFVDSSTKVRELPCKHTFHPECIDLYLRDSSSRCPMCKQAALPLGYCPVQVTYPMVLQERVNRRMQQRQAAAEGTTTTLTAGSGSNPRPAFSPPIRYTVGRATNQVTGLESQGDVEMTAVAQHSQVTLTDNVDRDETGTVPAEVAAQGAEARRAWHRQRLAQQRQEVFNEASENARRVIENRPLWRRVIGHMMPGMA